MAGGKRATRKRGRKRQPDNPAQSRKYIESVRALGLDESGKAFEEAMRAVLKAKAKRKRGGN
jgi:hypothetical protein